MARAGRRALACQVDDQDPDAAPMKHTQICVVVSISLVTATRTSHPETVTWCGSGPRKKTVAVTGWTYIGKVQYIGSASPRPTRVHLSSVRSFVSSQDPMSCRRYRDFASSVPPELFRCCAALVLFLNPVLFSAPRFYFRAPSRAGTVCTVMAVSPHALLHLRRRHRTWRS